MAKTTAIKYPRVMVSAKRHAQLMAEAKKRGITLTELGEHVFSLFFKRIK